MLLHKTIPRATPLIKGLIWQRQSLDGWSIQFTNHKLHNLELINLAGKKTWTLFSKCMPTKKTPLSIEYTPKTGYPILSQWRNSRRSATFVMGQIPFWLGIVDCLLYLIKFSEAISYFYIERGLIWCATAKAWSFSEIIICKLLIYSVIKNTILL